MACHRLRGAGHTPSEFLFFTKKPAQNGIDQSFGAGLSEALSGADGRRDGGMIRNPQPLQLIKAHPEQRSQLGVAALQRSCQQLAGLPLQPVMPPERAEAQSPEQGCVSRRGTFGLLQSRFQGQSVPHHAGVDARGKRSYARSLFRRDRLTLSRQTRCLPVGTR